MLKKGNKHLYPYEKCKQSQFQCSIITLVQTAGSIPTLYFVKIVVLLLGEQMRVSVFPGVDLPDKQRLEPAVFTERHKAPVAIRRERQRRNKRLDTIPPRCLTMCTSISLSSPITPISLLHAEQIESPFFDCVYFRRRAPPPTTTLLYLTKTHCIENLAWGGLQQRGLWDLLTAHNPRISRQTTRLHELEIGLTRQTQEKVQQPKRKQAVIRIHAVADATVTLQIV